jgi:Flp pilus assembly protein TadG
VIASRRRERRASERGTAIVELALALPLLLLLVLGTLDLGRAVYIHTSLVNAARDGARFGSVDPQNTACIQATAARNVSMASLGAGDVTVTRPGTLDLGQPITVSVRSVYRPLSPLVASIVDSSSLTLRAAATMQIRNLPSTPLACPAP